LYILIKQTNDDNDDDDDDDDDDDELRTLQLIFSLFVKSRAFSEVRIH